MMSMREIVWLGVAGLSACGIASCKRGGTVGNEDAALEAFYAAPADVAAGLAADGIYPRGRKMAFMGYSGDPARDLQNGFTVAGLVYGDQLPYLRKCFENRWPVVAHIGPKVTFHDKAPDKYKVDEPTLRAEVARQVKELAPHPEIVWWGVHPEELRPWRKDEMLYLEIVTSEIRAKDPAKRPIFLYNPNHRDAASLTTIARQVDVVAKGCYVNSVGKKRDRAWVRWSVEQESAAIAAAGRPGAIPVLMPELCKDPEAGEEKEIRAWVRHDIYLGMASGAKAVNIWSLFKRGEVRKTWQLWYDAYTECAKELNGERGLARVFLFGEKREDLKVEAVKAAGEGKLALGGSAEPETSSAKESEARTIAYPSWTAAEYAHGTARYLFLVNSSNEAAEFTVSGWPQGSRAENGFDGATVALPETGVLSVTLPAYGVTGWRFSRD